VSAELLHPKTPREDLVSFQECQQFQVSFQKYHNFCKICYVQTHRVYFCLYIIAMDQPRLFRCYFHNSISDNQNSFFFSLQKIDDLRKSRGLHLVSAYRHGLYII